MGPPVCDSLSYVRSGDVFREADEETKEVVALRFLKPSGQGPRAIRIPNSEFRIPDSGFRIQISIIGLLQIQFDSSSLFP